LVYVISPSDNLHLSKNWTVTLPPAHVTFTVNNRTNSSNSNPIDITIAAEPDTTDWIISQWYWYVVVLLLIAVVFGSIGGLMNYVIKYSKKRGMASTVQRETTDYIFDIDFDNFMEVKAECKNESYIICKENYRKYT
jgi:hypothetical protein